MNLHEQQAVIAVQAIIQEQQPLKLSTITIITSREVGTTGRYSWIQQ